MTNTVDEQHGTAGAPGSGAPGALSPDRGVPADPRAHRVVPLKAVGWRGNKQAKCAVCGKKVSTCCVKCSSPTAVVALCAPTITYKKETVRSGCCSIHGKDPDASHRSCCVKKSAGTKRRRPADDD